MIPCLVHRRTLIYSRLSPRPLAPKEPILSAHANDTKAEAQARRITHSLACASALVCCWRKPAESVRAEYTTIRKIGHRKGRRSKGFFFRKGRGWVAGDASRMVPLTYPDGTIQRSIANSPYEANPRNSPTHPPRDVARRPRLRDGDARRSRRHALLPQVLLTEGIEAISRRWSEATPGRTSGGGAAANTRR
jgi:hypothetical protein